MFTDDTRDTEGNVVRLQNIYVDVNGSKAPNTFGKDLFIFSYENGSILPNGSPNSAHPAASHCKNKKSTGLGCAYYVIMQGNMNYLH